jgi:hypothetical protein
MEALIDFLTFGLPAGFIGSVFTWFFGRRKRDNEMLTHLQASINMLSGENRKILDENIQLRRENADLKANQEEMILKLARLTKEVELLRKVINKKTGNEKFNPGGNPHAHANDNRAHPDGVCRGETVRGSAIANLGGNPDHAGRRRGGRSGYAADGADELRGVPAADDSRTDTGGDSGVTGDGGCSLAEPP